MPVATSSRRKPFVHRQNSEDIEDVRNTQANEDAVSDEEQPRAARTRVKTEKKEKGKQKATAEDDDDDDAGSEEDEDEDEDERIDVSNFPDQPLRRNDLNKLKGMSDDWKSMRAQITQRWDIYKDVATAMAEVGEKDIESSKDLQKLDRDMREFLDICAEMNAHSSALEAIHQRVAEGQNVVDAISQYEEGLQARKDDYAAQTTRKKYVKNPHYIEFHSSIWEVSHPKEPMPPLTNIIPREDGEESDDDDDLEIGGATQDYKCPLTLTMLEKPLTSRVCGHSFSADAIKQHCKPTHQLHKCPAAGCNKSFKISDCYPDEKLAKKVKTIIRRMKLTEEDSDAEEIVD